MKKGKGRDEEGNHKYPFTLFFLVFCSVLAWIFLDFLEFFSCGPLMIWSGTSSRRPTPYLWGERIRSPGDSRVGGLQSEEGFDRKVGPRSLVSNKRSPNILV